MKKLRWDFLNLEIEVPDDYPDGLLDFEARRAYDEKHPELVDKIVREYRWAYKKWLKTDDAKDYFARLGRPVRLDGRQPQRTRKRNHAAKKNQSAKAKARGQ